MTDDTPRPHAEPGLGLRYGGPRQRRPPMRTITTPLAAAICAGLLAAACSSGGAPPPPAPVLHPRTTTTTTEPPTPPTTVPEEAPLPPSRPAPEPEPADGTCHPAYEPCIPILDGDALDCDDIPVGDWPIAIWDPTDDPYQLGDGKSFLGCRPHIQTPAPEPERDTRLAPEPHPADHTEDPPPTPTTTQPDPAPAPPPTPDTTQTGPAAAPPSSDEPAPEVPTSQPVYEPPTAPPIGEVGEPTPATTEAPEPPEPDPTDDAAVTATTIPVTIETTTTTEASTDDADGYDAASVEVPCVDIPAHDGDRWCTPPVVGDTIQLFSDWGGLGTDGLTRCGYDAFDYTPYYDSGRTHDEGSRVCRMLPLALRVGMVIEDYDINGQQYQVHRVTGIGAEPWARFPIWTDAVYPVYLCSRYWSIFPGYEEHGFLPGPDTSEAMRIAWRDSDGRLRLLISPAMILVGGGC